MGSSCHKSLAKSLCQCVNLFDILKLTTDALLFVCTAYMPNHLSHVALLDNYNITTMQL